MLKKKKNTDIAILKPKKKQTFGTNETFVLTFWKLTCSRYEEKWHVYSNKIFDYHL